MTRGDGDERWLRDELEDSVADVEPRHTFDDIRARIEEETMDTPDTRSRNRWAAAAAGLAVAATVAAVALVTGISTGGDDPGPAASPSADATEPATTEATNPTDESSPPAVGGPVAVYYVGDTPTGPRLFREFRAAEGAGGLESAVAMAVSSSPLDPDYRVPWPAGTDATASFDEAGELLTIDVRGDGTGLRSRPSGMAQDEARIALEQLMYTAQAAVQARPPVRFLLDGEITDQLLGEPVSEPLAEGDPMQVQGTVWVISPQQGDEVAGTLTVEGRGAFFEANVSWQVLRDGDMVKEGFAMAQECCTLSPYRFEIRDLPPGDYELRVYDADMSDGEGPGEQEDTKRFSVTG
jgi:hypothetical protein